MKQTPILFLGDSPSLPGGLSRILRDLSCLVAAKIPEFRVATLGRGGRYDSRIPVPQYSYPVYDQWGENWLAGVWEDHSRGREEQRGVIMSIWDATRLTWLGMWGGLPGEHPLHRLMSSNGAPRLWGYFPVDAVGVGGDITGLARDTVAGYERVLAYTRFGRDVLDCDDWIPHGVNLDVFQPRDRATARGTIWSARDTVIGCVMTNQRRKDWGRMMEIMDCLAQRTDRRYVLWAKTDLVEHKWSLPALVVDLGLGDRVKVDVSPYTDQQMAQFYSACDVVVLPSLGEGFGYPLVEALACGTPVVHVDYGGGAELVPEQWRVPVRGLRLDGLHNEYRPMTWIEDWVERIDGIVDGMVGMTDRVERCRAEVEHLNWRKLWPVWEKWFRRGLENG